MEGRALSRPLAMGTRPRRSVARQVDLQHARTAPTWHDARHYRSPTSKGCTLSPSAWQSGGPLLGQLRRGTPARHRRWATRANNRSTWRNRTLKCTCRLPVAAAGRHAPTPSGRKRCASAPAHMLLLRYHPTAGRQQAGKDEHRAGSASDRGTYIPRSKHPGAAVCLGKRLMCARGKEHRRFLKSLFGRA